MLGQIPPYVRRVVPTLVLALGALSSGALAIQLLLLLPDHPLFAASFFGAATLLAVGAWGLWNHRFWARGFGLGAILYGGVGVGIWIGYSSIAIPTSLLAVLLLVADDAPGRYERREPSSRRRSSTAARRDGSSGSASASAFGLPSMLGSSLSIHLLLHAPAPTVIAALLGVLGFWGLTRLATWCYFAIVGAGVALAFAAVSSTLDGFAEAGGWGGLCAALLLASTLPLASPIWRHLRRD